MQTIYAHLDSTSPNISVGKKIKKGTIIGKVYKELHFEIIKQNRHINPLTIIE
jgi:murein DD-endopeptidase MepM/ murein hydrolase activator NlpD